MFRICFATLLFLATMSGCRMCDNSSDYCGPVESCGCSSCGCGSGMSHGGGGCSSCGQGGGGYSEGPAYDSAPNNYSAPESGPTKAPTTPATKSVMRNYPSQQINYQAPVRRTKYSNSQYNNYGQISNSTPSYSR